MTERRQKSDSIFHSGNYVNTIYEKDYKNIERMIFQFKLAYEQKILTLSEYKIYNKNLNELQIFINAFLKNTFEHLSSREMNFILRNLQYFFCDQNQKIQHIITEYSSISDSRFQQTKKNLFSTCDKCSDVIRKINIEKIKENLQNQCIGILDRVLLETKKEFEDELFSEEEDKIFFKSLHNVLKKKQDSIQFNNKEIQNLIHKISKETSELIFIKEISLQEYKVDSPNYSWLKGIKSQLNQILKLSFKKKLPTFLEHMISMFRVHFGQKIHQSKAIQTDQISIAQSNESKQRLYKLYNQKTFIQTQGRKFKEDAEKMRLQKSELTITYKKQIQKLTNDFLTQKQFSMKLQNKIDSLSKENFTLKSDITTLNQKQHVLKQKLIKTEHLLLQTEMEDLKISQKQITKTSNQQKNAKKSNLRTLRIQKLKSKNNLSMLQQNLQMHLKHDEGDFEVQKRIFRNTLNKSSEDFNNFGSLNRSESKQKVSKRQNNSNSLNNLSKSAVQYNLDQKQLPEKSERVSRQLLNSKRKFLAQSIEEEDQKSEKYLVGESNQNSQYRHSQENLLNKLNKKKTERLNKTVAANFSKKRTLYEPQREQGRFSSNYQKMHRISRGSSRSQLQSNIFNFKKVLKSLNKTNQLEHRLPSNLLSRQNSLQNEAGPLRRQNSLQNETGSFLLQSKMLDLKNSQKYNQEVQRVSELMKQKLTKSKIFLHGQYTSQRQSASKTFNKQATNNLEPVINQISVNENQIKYKSLRCSKISQFQIYSILNLQFQPLSLTLKQNSNEVNSILIDHLQRSQQTDKILFHSTKIFNEDLDTLIAFIISNLMRKISKSQEKFEKSIKNKLQKVILTFLSKYGISTTNIENKESFQVKVDMKEYKGTSTNISKINLMSIKKIKLQNLFVKKQNQNLKSKKYQQNIFADKSKQHFNSKSGIITPKISDQSQGINCKVKYQNKNKNENKNKNRNRNIWSSLPVEENQKYLEKYQPSKTEKNTFLATNIGHRKAGSCNFNAVNMIPLTAKVNAFKQGDFGVFIDEANAFIFECNQTKIHQKEADGELNPQKERFIDKIFEKIEQIRLKNPDLYREIILFIRYPYKTIKSTNWGTCIIKRLKYQKFMRLMQKIIMLHKDCPFPVQTGLCQHLSMFQKKIDSLQNKIQRFFY